jgi:hypothetical protein
VRPEVERVDALPLRAPVPGPGGVGASRAAEGTPHVRPVAFPLILYSLFPLDERTGGTVAADGARRPIRRSPGNLAIGRIFGRAEYDIGLN